jgi:hypothetical protein
MINLAQEMVFTAGARKGCAKFRVRERSTHGTDSAHRPKRNNGKPARQITDLKAKARENAGADHVRDHEARRSEQGNASRRRNGNVHRHTSKRNPRPNRRTMARRYLKENPAIETDKSRRRETSGATGLFATGVSFWVSFDCRVHKDIGTCCAKDFDTTKETQFRVRTWREF